MRQKSADRARSAVVMLAALAILAGCGDPASTDGAPAAVASTPRPNVLLIVADDMGYNELGSWGSEIRTPNLDALALNGLRFTNFHAAPSCAPARAMLMSGASNHEAGVGSMNIKRAYDGGRPLPTDSPQFGRPGYEGHLSDRIAALPEILSAAGYRTYMAGKWDLGRALEEDHNPANRGFGRSFILTTGTAAHLGFPDRNASGGVERADRYPYRDDGAPVTELSEDYFSTREFTDRLIGYLEADGSSERPFFAWLAYTAPHSPIQVPDDWLDRYAGAFDEGYEVVRDRRFARAKAIGILPSDVSLDGYRSTAPAWESLSAEERRTQSRIMELYASMLENMDYHVGRLVSYLEETGELANTVVLFMSDNGAASGGIPYPPMYETNHAHENLGRYDTWLNYGRGWAEAATAPFRDTKGSMAEGGTRVAAFVSHAAVANPGGIDRSYLTFMDVAPTILELTGVEHPGTRFEGREVLPMRGRSFWPRVLGDEAPVYAADEAVGSELHGHRALVRGDWKALMPASTGEWELYNLASDPGERRNLAASNPELLAELVADWERFAGDAGVVY